MNPELAPIVENYLPQLMTAGVVFLRIGGLVLFVPGFGDRNIPARVRLVIAILLALVIAPMINLPATQTTEPVALLILILKEVTIGAFFGILLRLFIFTLQVAGTIAGQSVSLSQMLGGSAALDAQPAISALLVMAGTTLAIILGLHLKIIAYIMLSYSLLPLGLFLDPQIVWQVGVGQIASCFYLGFVLAGPFLLGSLIYNLTLGFISKAMPQIMVSIVGAPAVTLGGLLLMMISLGVILRVWLDAFDQFMFAPGAVF